MHRCTARAASRAATASATSRAASGGEQSRKVTDANGKSTPDRAETRQSHAASQGSRGWVSSLDSERNDTLTRGWRFPQPKAWGTVETWFPRRPADQ